MNFLRKIDSAILDRIQTLIEAISSRTGYGKRGILRDLNVGCSMVHVCCALAVVSEADMIVRVSVVVLVVVCLARAWDHGVSARTENTPDRWADAAAMAAVARDEKVYVRLWVGTCTTLTILMAIVFAPRFVEALRNVGVGYAPAIYSLLLFMASDMIREFFDAVQPPRPGERRKEPLPSRDAAAETPLGIRAR